MTLKILPCTPADVPTIVSIYFSAFQNPVALAAFPDVPSVRQWWTDMLNEEITDPNAVFVKVLDTENDEVIAWGQWNKPADGDEEDEEDNLPRWPEGGDKELCEEFFGGLAAKHETAVKGRHWYLELLATKPEHQGLGAGSLILRYGLDEADKQECQTYLEASPTSVALYRKFGFKEVDRVEVVVNGEVYCNLCMVREPKRA